MSGGNQSRRPCGCAGVGGRLRFNSSRNRNPGHDNSLLKESNVSNLLTMLNKGSYVQA